MANVYTKTGSKQHAELLKIIATNPGITVGAAHKALHKHLNKGGILDEKKV